MKITSLVGARPNFIKIALFMREIEGYNMLNNNAVMHIVAHTDQQYDDRMSKVFLNIWKFHKQI